MEINKLEFSHNTTKDNFIYLNIFGALFKDEVVLNNNSKNIIVNLTEIRKVIIQKKKDLLWSKLLIFVFIVLLSFFFYSKKTITFNDWIVASICGLVISMVFFFYRKINYKLIVFLNGNTKNIIEIDVNKAHKEQAKKLMSKINRRIKETNQKRYNNTIDVQNTIDA